MDFTYPHLKVKGDLLLRTEFASFFLNYAFFNYLIYEGIDFKNEPLQFLRTV
jgi:hypothetical protein